MIVALIGVDGSGKTTQATMLIKALKEKGIQCEYRHPYFEYIFLNRFLSFFSGPTKVLRAKKNSNFSSKDRGLLKFWPILTFIDNLMTYFLSMRQHAKGSLLICDRYFIDNIVTFLTEGICNMPIARALVALIPKPDLIVWLDVPPILAFKRKPEHTLPVYQRLKANYLQLLSSSGRRTVAVDAGKPISDVSYTIFNYCAELAGIVLSRPELKNTMFS